MKGGVAILHGHEVRRGKGWSGYRRSRGSYGPACAIAWHGGESTRSYTSAHHRTTRLLRCGHIDARISDEGRHSEGLASIRRTEKRCVVVLKARVQGSGDSRASSKTSTSTTAPTAYQSQGHCVCALSQAYHRTTNHIFPLYPPYTVACVRINTSGSENGSN